MNRGDEGPDPGQNRVITRDRRQRELDTAAALTVGAEDAEQPLEVPGGSVEEAPELPEIGGASDGDDAAEDALVLAQIGRAHV